MSIATPISADFRRRDIICSVGQIVFNLPVPVYDMADVKVSKKVGGASFWTAINSGFTVTLAPTTKHATVTFLISPYVAGSNIVIRVESRRLASRVSDVTRGNVIVGAKLEKELDVQTVTDQELRRDTNDIAEAAQSIFEAAADAATSAIAAAASASEAEQYAQIAIANSNASLLLVNTSIAIPLLVVNSLVQEIKTGGYFGLYDGGGATYKRLPAAPSPVKPWHFASNANTVWWEMVAGAVTPAMFGAKGDGITNDTAAIQATLDYGAPVFLKKGANYAVNAITFNDGCRVTANGAKFSHFGGVSGGASFITVIGNVVIDELNAYLPTGKELIRAVLITGIGAQIGALKCEYQTQFNNRIGAAGYTASNLDAAVQLRGTGTEISKFTVSNVDNAVISFQASFNKISGINISKCYRGIYIRESNDLIYENELIDGSSPNAAPAPGCNGILRENSNRVFFSGGIIKDIGEHGIRTGGFYNCDNFTISDVIIDNPGKCGIKSRVGSGFTAGDIKLVNITTYDCGSGVIAVNEDAFLMERVKSLTMVNCLVKKKATGTSCNTGITLYQVDNFTFNNVIIEDAFLHGLDIGTESVNDASVAEYNSSNFIQGELTVLNCGGNGININLNNETVRYINIEATINGANGYGVNAVQYGTGAMLQPSSIAGLVTNCAIGQFNNPNNMFNLLVNLQGATQNVDTLQHYNGRYLYGTSAFKGNERFIYNFAGSGEVGYASVATGNVVSKHWDFWNNSTFNVGSITTSSTATQYNTTSDYRIKTIDNPFKGALDKLAKIPVYWGCFNADKVKKQILLLAHEVQDIAPYAVQGQKDAVDEAGNFILQQVDYSQLVPLLIAGLNEANAKISKLEGLK